MVLVAAAAAGMLAYFVSSVVHGPTHNIGASLGDLIFAGLTAILVLIMGALRLRRNTGNRDRHP